MAEYASIGSLIYAKFICTFIFIGILKLVVTCLVILNPLILDFLTDRIRELASNPESEKKIIHYGSGVFLVSLAL
jgi:uncharacterized SAM-binding protein YcdF (DUF218 family)